jgi:hypothetical protein
MDLLRIPASAGSSLVPAERLNCTDASPIIIVTKRRAMHNPQ